MPSSRDLPQTPVRENDQRDVKDAMIKDADKTDVADRDKIHGDRESLGLGKAGGQASKH